MSAYNQGRMCEVCGLKPKAGSHDFCSKTCAAQAATLCDYCRQRPKFGGFDYCGKSCKNAASVGSNGGGGGGGSMTGGGYGSWVSQAISQVKNMTGAGANPPPPTKGFAPAPSFPPVNPPPWQTKQSQQGPRLNTKLPPMTVNIFPPAPGNNQRQSVYRSLPAGYGASTQYPKASGSSFAGPHHEDPTEVDKGAMENDLSVEHAIQSYVPLCIMCNSTPQRDTDYFCGTVCKRNAMTKEVELPE